MRRVYLDKIGDSLNSKVPFDMLDRFQQRLECCGVWSYTDYVTHAGLNSIIGQSQSDSTSDTLTLPSTCCPAGK